MAELQGSQQKDPTHTSAELLELAYHEATGRRTTSRQVGENGLYICGGTDEFTGSPGSNNSSGIPTQKQPFSFLLAAYIPLSFSLR
ncbi:hypothetical protein XENOCAPTIV_021065 [Xenoophorus captivus]|uniref:Uncharacterized protein n=1 Tax=Xenoophorus captivus TaxID=1517983 RepID=A0ABV0Q6H2_9TELE